MTISSLTPVEEKYSSVKQLIGRVVDTISEWARKQHYFASDEARYVTGQVLGVDGGIVMGS